MPEKTFEEIEKQLFAMEDQLLKDMEDPEFKDGAISPVEEVAKDIAADWVRYSKMPRQEGVSPRYKVAIKHVAVLLGHHTYFEKQLKYGREEAQRESELKGKMKVPILTITTNILAIEKVGGNKIQPYRTIEGGGTLTLDLILSCERCAARGKCDITSKCMGYNEKAYNAAVGPRQDLLEPTQEDFLTFEKYARGVRAKK
jgi:hypothetical protein